MTAPVLAGKAAARILARLDQLADLARVMAEPAKPSGRGTGDTEAQ